MAVAVVTYSFAPLTDILSSEANTNFQDLVSFLNTEVIHKDASVAFTAVPAGPALNPVGDNQFTRKAYVDAGGTLSASVLTLEATTNGSFVDLATVGPAVTMTPFSGKVLVHIYCNITTSAVNNQTAIMGFALSGGNTLAAADQRAVGQNSGTGAGNFSTIGGATFLLTGLAAVSTTFTAKYRSSGGASATFANRLIIVQGLSA